MALLYRVKWWNKLSISFTLEVGCQDALCSLHPSATPRSSNLSPQTMQACTRGTPRWYVGHACAHDAAGWQNTTPACPRQCVSACVVCSWQTYCTSVKMQAATWSTVNSAFPSSPVYHSSSLTIAQGPTGINTHSLYPCCFSSKHCPVMDSWGFELQRCAVTVTIIQTLEDWRVIELWPVMEFLQLFIRELTFTFAYCKWSLMYLQHVSSVSGTLPLLDAFVASEAFPSHALIKTKDFYRLTFTFFSRFSCFFFYSCRHA